MRRSWSRRERYLMGRGIGYVELFFFVAELLVLNHLTNGLI